MAKIISSKTRRAVWQKTNGICWYCGIQTEPFGDKQGKTQFTIDHIVSIRHGGNHSLENLVPSCKSCNSAKRCKSLEEFREWKNLSEIQPLKERQVETLMSLGYDLSAYHDHVNKTKFVFHFERVSG